MNWILATTLILSMMPGGLLEPLAEGTVATYYPGVMKQVAANRGMVMLDWVDGYASSRHCYRVDTRADPSLKVRPWFVQASINGREAEIFQLVDCSHPRDMKMHVSTGLILEVDHASGRRNRVSVHRKQVTIYKIWRD